MRSVTAADRRVTTPLGRITVPHACEGRFSSHVAEAREVRHHVREVIRPLTPVNEAAYAMGDLDGLRLRAIRPAMGATAMVLAAYHPLRPVTPRAEAIGCPLLLALPVGAGALISVDRTLVPDVEWAPEGLTVAGGRVPSVATGEGLSSEAILHSSILHFVSPSRR